MGRAANTTPAEQAAQEQIKSFVGSCERCQKNWASGAEGMVCEECRGEVTTTTREAATAARREAAAALHRALLNESAVSATDAVKCLSRDADKADVHAARSLLDDAAQLISAACNVERLVLAQEDNPF